MKKFKKNSQDYEEIWNVFGLCVIRMWILRDYEEFQLNFVEICLFYSFSLNYEIH